MSAFSSSFSLASRFKMLTLNADMATCFPTFEYISNVRIEAYAGTLTTDDEALSVWPEWKAKGACLPLFLLGFGM